MQVKNNELVKSSLPPFYGEIFKFGKSRFKMTSLEVPNSIRHPEHLKQPNSAIIYFSSGYAAMVSCRGFILIIGPSTTTQLFVFLMASKSGRWLATIHDKNNLFLFNAQGKPNKISLIQSPAPGSSSQGTLHTLDIGLFFFFITDKSLESMKSEIK